jgi:hypothetical protein
LPDSTSTTPYPVQLLPQSMPNTRMKSSLSHSRQRL